MNNTNNSVPKESSQLAATKDDFLNKLKEDASTYTSSAYVAVISINLSKRKINRENMVLYYVVEGDSLEDALEELLLTDESSGLLETDLDLNGDILTIEMEALA